MAGRKLGLVLGSGGAKGFAHVGVLKALEEHGIRPDIVIGSSMGSLIGAFYVTGMRPAFMERLARTLTWRHWLDLTVPKVGLVSGDKIHQMVTLLTRGLEFGQLDVRFGVVATDLIQRRSVLITEGRIADAVRASIAIPGVFVPHVVGDHVLVDGGVLDRVPVHAAKLLGADIVIAVDVGAVQRGYVPETMIDVIMQSLDLMQQQIVSQGVQDADLYLTPDVSAVGSAQFHKAREAIDCGYSAARDAMGEIERLLNARTGDPDRFAQ